MKGAVWTRAIKESADPARARHFLELLSGVPGAQPALAHCTTEQARVLAVLFNGSQALSTLLVTHPEWLQGLESESLKFPRRKQGLREELDRTVKPLLGTGDFGAALSRTREFKQREMLRVGGRDLARLGTTGEIIQEISDVADVCLETVWQVCYRQAVLRHGEPYHRNAQDRWQRTTACVLGLGKLGGQELNYSSDVDVMFLYSDEGEVYKETPVAEATARGQRRSRTAPTPRPALTNHQFFNRLAEAFIAEVTRLAPEGVLYRIDLRLRPEGDAGPLTRSLAGCENYYAQWGQTWERMMLIKARGVAGDGALAAEFLEMIQPFRYPRSINESALHEVGRMKDRIENEVVRPGELERNVKLGRGGIREVEFVAQALQLLHAGRQPFLQGARTLACLEKLADYEWLSRDESRMLREAYDFLRDIEHRLQMEDNRQTHTIPEERQARERLARLMGFSSLMAFESAHQARTSQVRAIFDKVLQREVPAGEDGLPFPRQFAGFETEWEKLLADHSFRDPGKAFRTLREFVEGPGFGHISVRTSELAMGLLSRLFARCPAKVQSLGPASRESSSSSSSKASGESRTRTRTRTNGTLSNEAVAEVQSLGQNAPLSDPDRVVTRLDSFISAYGARATLFELWHSNPAIFDLLVLLFDRSEFLAELAIRTPDLVDELVTGDRLRQRKPAEETLRDLRHGLGDADQHLWLRRYHQAELMRIGLRDILGLADFEQYLTELSALADACLQYAVESVMRRHRLKTPPFVIIGLGKLGGAEIDYGSDLDLVFVADTKAKDLAKLSRMAVEVMDLISRRTEQGMVFHTDARLRPDGEKGLLVNTLKAYEEYYRHRAQLWEIQTLTRTRPVAGARDLGERFQALAGKLANFRQPSLPLTAFAPDWKRQIHRMRTRIEKERTPVGKDSLAIKTGSGGLVDAEFVAQTVCLEQGWQEPNTLRALERARDTGLLPDAELLVENYRRLRRVEGILRRWSYEGETALPDDPAPYYRVSVRCGFATPEAFRKTLAEWRRKIREVYQRVFADRN
jgi:glutamate-ammonia-ligase adenylyltransferase